LGARRYWRSMHECLVTSGTWKRTRYGPEWRRVLQDWRWSSLGDCAGVNGKRVQLTQWPVARPAGWIERVNAMAADEDLERLRLCIRRSRPFEDDGIGHVEETGRIATFFGTPDLPKMRNG
jgi:hypothetical protein